MRNYDVIVIGGGPAGLLSAREVAGEGLKVLVVEEHAEIGSPVQCSGLFSVSGLKTLDLDLPDYIIANTIRGGRFYSPGNIEITAHSRKDRARVVKRRDFDKHLANETMNQGAYFSMKTSAQGILKKDNTIEVSLKGPFGKEIVGTKVLIGADGIRSNVARWSGISTPKSFVGAAQVEVASTSVEDDMAELYFGREVAPNFYAWILPKGDVYEVGVGSKGPKGALGYLEDFIFRHPVASKKINPESILEFNAGGIPVSSPIETVADRVMIVGDAGGFTKASTGGGVITGGISGILAGKAAISAVGQEEFSRGFLEKEYEDKWREELGTDLRVHELFRTLFDSLDDRKLDYLFNLAKKGKISEIMVKYDDTDRPSEFFKELIQNEALMDFMQKAIKLEDFN